MFVSMILVAGGDNGNFSGPDEMVVFSDGGCDTLALKLMTIDDSDSRGV